MPSVTNAGQNAGRWCKSAPISSRSPVVDLVHGSAYGSFLLRLILPLCPWCLHLSLCPLPFVLSLLGCLMGLLRRCLVLPALLLTIRGSTVLPAPRGSLQKFRAHPFPRILLDNARVYRYTHCCNENVATGLLPLLSVSHTSGALLSLMCSFTRVR
jgi:hypothetical protein